jgi:hypothetical protein
LYKVVFLLATFGLAYLASNLLITLLPARASI